MCILKTSTDFTKFSKIHKLKYTLTYKNITISLYNKFILFYHFIFILDLNININIVIFTTLIPEFYNVFTVLFTKMW